ncbi:MAG: Glu/Leu/Phe/Val dehydrogenase dimerization domain-containing protein, partial [Pseudomonas aeruginosa]|nr:Glu/Leu/Phe/Val dehydrogenase dimerization domain-containing protein [Pseudomonas aeruginosa]
MFDMMDAARLEGLHLAQDPATGLKAIIAIHSTRLGPALGGCRYLPYPNDEAAIGDAIRLAQGMSYKAALAGLEQGGGKAVIIRPPHLDNRGALFEAFGRFIESLGGRYITAVDSGTSSADMDCIAQQTRHVTSTTQAGDPSPHTALGVFAGIRASAQARLGSDDLEGLRVAVQGLGHVGYALAEQLAAVGAELLVCDLDPGRVQLAVEQLGAHPLAPEALLSTPCDILAPCGLGGVLTSQSVSQLRCAAVAGAAPAFDTVVNTVPAPVLTEPVLAALRPGSLIVDLASRPGGTDFAAAQRLGHTAVHALSLPAACAPET